MLKSTFNTFRSIIAALPGMWHSRPDIWRIANRLYLMTENKFKTKHIRYVSKLFSFMKKTKYPPLTYRKLYSKILRITVYSDGSFASNEGNCLQINVDFSLFCSNFLFLMTLNFYLGIFINFFVSPKKMQQNLGK